MSDFIKVMDNFHIKKWTIATKKHHEIEHVHDVTVSNGEMIGSKAKSCCNRV
jgi:hypothetical protein